MMSHDNIGFYLLSQEVSKHVKVVQSGQGADEVFGGYHWYPPLLESGASFKTYRDLFFDRSSPELDEMLEPQWRLPNFAENYLREEFEQAGANRCIDRALRMDTSLMLTDDPVKRVDNMTMSAGLEARVPFLDHELVELAAQIPAEAKVKDSGKFILKELARNYIPSAVIDRPKGYFPVPQLKYLKGESLDFVRNILSQQAARSRGILNRRYVDKLLLYPEDHLTPLRGSKLWQIAILEFWLQTHGI
jgi:asparagine synthase (glutamine-hydrolysing)